jgi:hypothetical protein
MALVEQWTLIAKLAPPFHPDLAKRLVEEFVSLERRFVLRDWEPAELDGGQFAEILGRAVYHIDSGTLNLTKDLNECLRYIEDETGNAHAITPRHDAIHIARVLRTVYKFRSQRGAVHISPNYSANQMDSKLIVECVRWLMMEALRIFSKFTREEAAKAIREISEFDVPCVGKFEDIILVQRTDLKPEEEILVLLHFAGEVGFSRTELGKYAMLPAPTVTRTIQSLEDPKKRMIVQIGKNYRLTDLGSKRIRTDLSQKLLLE